MTTTAKTTNDGGILKGARLVFNDDQSAALLDYGNALPPAQKVPFVQAFRIGSIQAQRAVAEHDELVKKARRAAAAKADEVELAQVFEKVNGSLDKAESIIKGLGDENAMLRGKLGEAAEAIQKVYADTEDLAKTTKAGMAELRAAVVELGKTAAVASPLRNNPRELAARSKADAIAVLEKVLGSATSEVTQIHLKNEIAALKAQ